MADIIYPISDWSARRRHLMKKSNDPNQRMRMRHGRQDA